MNQRAKAARIINQIVNKKRSAYSVIPQIISNVQKPADRSLIKEISFGVIRWHYFLNTIAEQLLFTPLKPKHQDITQLLIVGLYQLIYMRVPEYAAVSETVAGAKALRKPWATGLINKTLRTFIAKKEEYIDKARQSEVGRFSHPQWLIDLVREKWPERWEEILVINNTHPPMCLRINPLQTTRDDYLTLLSKHEISAFPAEYADYGIQLEKPRPVNLLPFYMKGIASVQGISGQLVYPLLDLAPGQRILDACAAPGGKTCNILERQPDLDRVIAIDIDAERLGTIKESVERLKIPHQTLQLILSDATHTKEWWDGTLFDRILLDAPCSGTGVIRRHPDIKILRRPEDIDKQRQLQLLLLKSLWPLLAPGGRLVYTTCSILPQENNELVAEFKKSQPDVQTEAVPIEYGIECDVGRQVLPETNGIDGFYYAILNKKK